MRPRSLARTALIVTALGMSVGLTASPAEARQVAANSLLYKNNGTYSAYMVVEFKTVFEGEQVTCQVEPRANPLLESKEEATIDLTGTKWRSAKGGKEACLNDDLTIPEGTEVWGRIKILAGETHSCRKDTKVIYRADGGTMKYRSGGTTFNNNRCKVSSWPS